MSKNKELTKLLLNRELGLIEFYRRVLYHALNPDLPILERLNYLSIVTKNCDEFFEVRVSRLISIKKENPSKILNDGLTANESLKLIRKEMLALYVEIYRIYHQIIIPLLQENKIYILQPSALTRLEANFIYQYFINELKPVLTPIGIDPSHPFPRVPNKGLHFAVELEGEDQFGRKSQIAIVEAPRILPRVIKLPADISTVNSFVLLQDIIQLHVNEFFLGMKVKGCYPFRVTRSATINVSLDFSNFKSALTLELGKRKYAECTRFEIDISHGVPSDNLIKILLWQFNLELNDLYQLNGPMNLSRLNEINLLLNQADLMYPVFLPSLPTELQKEKDIFKAMQKSDILIHTPYQSFNPILELTKLAAADPKVLAVKVTVYRTGIDSVLIENLVRAAKAGKQVVVSVELLARFDEEANVELAKQLEDAGAHVVYGVMGYKVHAKMLVIIRRDDDALRHYVHLGTGNYHHLTAKAYTDFGLLTTNSKIAQDVDTIFSQITGVGKAGILNLLCDAPFNLHDKILKAIARETYNAMNGIRAEIIAKMNSLIENQVIYALYKASQAGVKINLIVRGACALRPGIPGLSDNIIVKSVVGRFLEHHRIFYFYDSGEEEVFISSADWMGRNFFRRVEVCVPILEPKIKRRVINEGLKIYLQDNLDSWLLDKEGKYIKIIPQGKKISAQDYLLKKLTLKPK